MQLPWISRRRYGFAPSGDTGREDIPPPPDAGRAVPETERLLAEAREAFYAVRRERDAVACEARKGWAKAAELAEQRDVERARRVELERAIREFVTSEDTHEPGPFVKDGNWHTGPCVEGGPRVEDVYPDGFQVCADEECFAYWPCDVECLRRVLDGDDR